MLKELSLSVILFFLTIHGTEAAKVKNPHHIFVVSSLADSGSGTLRQAILDAESSPGLDKIVFNVSGTITLAPAPLSINKELIIDGHEVITISGGGEYAESFVINSGAKVTLENLKITDRYIGVRNAGGSLFVNNSEIYNHTIGLLQDSGITVINRSKIYGNHNYCQGVSGLGIYSGSLVLNRTSVTDNDSGICDSGGGAGGIDIGISGHVKIYRSIIAGNGGSSAGGIVNGGNLSISKSLIKNNSDYVQWHWDDVQGGGIFNTDSGNLKINQSTIENNESTIGGGVNNNGTMIINNSIIKNNRAIFSDPFGDFGVGGYGGGIFNTGTASIKNTSIRNNEGSIEGGGLSNGGSTILKKSIIKHNISSSGGGIANGEGGTLSIEKSVINSNNAYFRYFSDGWNGEFSVGGYGGGILNKGILSANNSLIRRNYAEIDGGGIFNSGSVSLFKSRIIYNSPNDCSNC